MRLNLLMHTELGEFSISLDIENAPETAGYFKEIIEGGGFNEATVFRIVNEDNTEIRKDAKIEVVQLGQKELESPYSKSLKHETTVKTGLSHKKWAVSAARFDVGQNYPSFFICMRDEPELDYGGKRHPDGQGFAVFGEVTSGFNVVELLFSMAGRRELLEKEIKILSTKISDTELV